MKNIGINYGGKNICWLRGGEGGAGISQKTDMVSTMQLQSYFFRLAASQFPSNINKVNKYKMSWLFESS